MHRSKQARRIILPTQVEDGMLRVMVRYDGPEVADGSIAADDIVSAIQGFSSAYEKLAKRENAQGEHRIRITALEKESADIIIGVWGWMGTNLTQLQALSYGVGSAAGIVGVIGAVIKLKKHVASKPFSLGPITLNVITVKNSENVSIEVSPRDFKVFQEKLIDEDVAKIVRPLQKGKIDKAQLISLQANVSESVDADDRDSFLSEITTVTTKEDWLTGQLVSLNKETNNGTFRLPDGHGVPYHLVADKPDEMYEDFAYRGFVRAYAKVTFDENLRPTKMEISRLERVQGTLALTLSNEE